MQVIDRFLDTEVALSKNFRRADEKGVSLKFSEAVARGLCHRLVGAEQAETMRAQMYVLCNQCACVEWCTASWGGRPRNAIRLSWDPRCAELHYFGQV